MIGFPNLCRYVESILSVATDLHIVLNSAVDFTEKDFFIL